MKRRIEGKPAGLEAIPDAEAHLTVSAGVAASNLFGAGEFGRHVVMAHVGKLTAPSLVARSGHPCGDSLNECTRDGEALSRFVGFSAGALNLMLSVLGAV